VQKYTHLAKHRTAFKSFKMNLSERMQSLAAWGKAINELQQPELDAIFLKAENKNRWFTRANSKQALNGILLWLKADVLKEWTDRHSGLEKATPKTIGLVMAGNIPLVGFHDLLCVLISGHKAKVKLSSQDDVLLPYLTHILCDMDQRWSEAFSFAERLNNVDAVIATGSDNSARYFEYYFRSIPKIIRKNRTSVGVIMGEEGPDELTKLGTDVFSYFGMGCRNVSKIFIPEGFDLNLLKKPFDTYREIIDHNKYANNYDYQRAIRLVSSKTFTDFDHLMLEESNELVSPISVLYFQYYSGQHALMELLSTSAEKIQCLVSANGWLKGSIPFGGAQTPKIDDYADGIDTLSFVGSIL
jgi:hypothetical protein